MAQPYVGEIRMFAGNFNPAGWEFCDGRLLLISAYQTLFQLIGTTYGGDGQSTFRVPDLRGRLPIHFSTSYPMAATGGTETVTLLSSQIPSHTHALRASTQLAPQGSAVPAGAVLGQVDGGDLYASTGRRSTTLAANSLQVSGGSQPHENTPPYLCVNFIISFSGIYPSRS